MAEYNENILYAGKTVFKVPKAIYEKFQNRYSKYKVKTVVYNRCTLCKCNTAINDCEKYCTKDDVSNCFVYARNINIYTQRKLRINNRFKAQKTNVSIRELKLKVSTNNCFFTRTQILQLLMYYYLCNSNGTIEALSKRELANIIGCSLTTIDNNNSLFERHGICMTRRDFRAHLFVKIFNYEEQFSEGGSGYLEVPSNFLKDLINKQEISGDKLRLLLKALIKFDYNYVTGRNTRIKKTEFKTVLTSACKSVAALCRITDTINNSFNNLISFKYMKDGAVYVQLDSSLSGKAVKADTIRKYTNKLRDFMDTNNVFEEYKNVYNDKSKEIVFSDLLQLSLQYGYNIVERALLELKSNKVGTIRNVGGFIRTTIENYIGAYGVCLKLI